MIIMRKQCMPVPDLATISSLHNTHTTNKTSTASKINLFKIMAIIILPLLSIFSLMIIEFQKLRSSSERNNLLVSNLNSASDSYGNTWRSFIIDDYKNFNPCGSECNNCRSGSLSSSTSSAILICCEIVYENKKFSPLRIGQILINKHSIPADNYCINETQLRAMLKHRSSSDPNLVNLIENYYIDRNVKAWVLELTKPLDVHSSIELGFICWNGTVKTLTDHQDHRSDRDSSADHRYFGSSFVRLNVKGL